MEGKPSADSFDLGPKLKQRLRESNAIKDETADKIEASMEQLQRMIKAAPKKPRDSKDIIIAKLADLEAQRTRSSLPLSEEKKILRQMDAIKRSKSQLDTYHNHENGIKEKKNEIIDLRDKLRSATAAIAELESACSKVDLAKRLGCTLADLVDRQINCPPEKMGRVIGKQGSALKRIEERTGVLVNIDKVGSTIHLCGSSEALDAAQREVESITLAVDESFVVSSATISYLLGSRRLGILDKFKQKHPGVHIDFGKDKTTIGIRGRPANVSAAKVDILGLSITSMTRAISPREARLVVGKGGSTVNALVTKHGVVINTSDEGEEKSPKLEIIGPKDSINAALVDMEDIFIMNEEVVETMLVHSLHRTKLVSNAGEGIKAIQAEINKELGSDGSQSKVFLGFERQKSKKRSTAGPSNLEVRAVRSNISKAKELVQKYIDEFQADLLTIPVSFDIIPIIIGKGGSTIKAIKNEKEGGAIEIDDTLGVVTIQSDDKETRTAMKNAVEKIIAENQKCEVPIQKSIIGALLGGEAGKSVRKKISAVGVNLSIDAYDTNVVLRGTKEQISQCAEIVKGFVDDNYSEGYVLHVEDEPLLFHGGEKSLVKRIERDHHVSAHFRSTQHQLLIRGKKDNVKAAITEVERFFVGGDGFSVSKILVPESVLGQVIGKGGANFSRLQEENNGISLRMCKESNQLSIRGPSEEVEKCRADIVSKISSARIVVSMPVSAEQRDDFEKAGLLRAIASDTNTQLTLKESSIRFRGVSSDVRDAKALVLERLTGKYKGVIELDGSQFRRVRSATEDQTHFDRIRSSTQTDVWLDEATNALCIEGKRSGVKKAKILVLSFLEFLLPSEVERVKVIKPLMKSMGDPAALRSIASDSSASIILDRDISSIMLRSSNPENVQSAAIMVKARMKECEKLIHVYSFNREDAWIISKIIGPKGKSISALQKGSGCSIDVSKDDSLVVISGEAEEQVKQMKGKLDEIIEKAKKECIFLDIPESAMSAFIGKAGSNINKIRDENSVTIERMKKNSTKVQIQGSELAVAGAKSSIDEWLREWEVQHFGIEIAVEGEMIPAILGKNGSVVNSIQKDLGIRIDVNRTSSIVTVRGGDNTNRLAAMKRIEALIKEQKTLATERAEEGKQKATEAAAARPESVLAAKVEKKNDTDKTRIEPYDKGDGSQFAIIPVGISMPKTGREKKGNIIPNSGSGTATGRALFDILVSDSDDIPLDEGTAAGQDWDSSTVSSDKISSNDVLDQVYYKTSSGFSVRI